MRKFTDSLSLTLFSIGFLMALVVGLALYFSMDSLTAIFEASASDDQTNEIAALNAITNAVMALAILGTVLIAHVAYRVTTESAAKTARLQKTFDFISQQVNDKDLIDLFDSSRAILKKFSEANRDVTYASVMEFDQEFRGILSNNGIHIPNRRTTADQIINLLNYYETWSIGIEEGALDEGILKKWWRSTYVAHWDIYRPFIEGHRRAKGQPKTFRQFEQLAQKWAAEDES